MDIFENNSNINKKLPYISISQVLTLVATPKDQEKMLENTFNKHYDNPESEYYHLTKEQIKEIWENKGADSRHYGSLLDDYIGIKLTGTSDELEMYKLDNDVDGDDRLKGLISSFENFWSILSKSGDMEFVTREKTVYYKVKVKNPNYKEDSETEPEFLEFNIKGRFDALFRNKRTGKWVIIDWKSSKSIDTNNRWQKLLGPVKMYDDCNWVTYTMQGYFYKTGLIYSRYLPEGTTEDDVEFLIIQLPGFVIEGDKDFKIHKPAFKYDKEFMDRVFEFAIKKQILLKQQEEKNKENK